MNGNLEKVAIMIKKTFRTKAQIDCFDGCILYVEKHCEGVRASCVTDMNNKFKEIQDTLKDINGKLDQAIGNGNGEH